MHSRSTEYKNFKIIIVILSEKNSLILFRVRRIKSLSSIKIHLLRRFKKTLDKIFRIDTFKIISANDF